MRKPSCLAIALLLAGSAIAQHDPAMHATHALPPNATAPSNAGKDGRLAVGFPATLKAHTLANMRDHLLALQEIQAALAQAEYDRAADVAEQRIGMSSLGRHGAHDVAKYMPAGMREAGSAMHRVASRFGIAARDAAVTQDVKPVLAALSDVTAACVACHTGWRFK